MSAPETAQIGNPGSGPVPSERPSDAHWFALSLLFATGAAVRFACLACKPFWFDECFSVEAARIDWRNFLHLLWWREANMSLYYVLLRIWLSLSFHSWPGEYFTRSLSVLAAVST